MHKAGFINIIGKPNVGKSTLLNQLIGEKLAIVTSKPQTTRQRMLAIYNDDDHQLIFSDTPGLIYEPAYELQKSMNKYIYSSFEDADAILFITDIFDNFEYTEKFLASLKSAEVPKYLVINKMDLGTEEKISEQLEKWHEIIQFTEVFIISAKSGINTDNLIKSLKENIPASPPYYPKDQFTDKTERFFVEELIREKILMLYQKEVPYSVQVVVDEWRDAFRKNEKLIYIQANIFISRKSQKHIIIGRKGEMIKKLGTLAREDIEEFLGSKVFLELIVKELDDWRNDEKTLKKLGY
ncbi:MAG: GTPase Era [Deltaproteobacteria bacterium]